MSNVQVVKAMRLASALVKKGQYDSRMIRRVVASKRGVLLDTRTIAGIRRSHVYQVGKALSLVM